VRRNQAEYQVDVRCCNRNPRQVLAAGAAVDTAEPVVWRPEPVVRPAQGPVGEVMWDVLALSNSPVLLSNSLVLRQVY
jgi:hypothetical protein